MIDNINIVLQSQNERFKIRNGKSEILYYFIFTKSNFKIKIEINVNNLIK